MTFRCPQSTDSVRPAAGPRRIPVSRLFILAFAVASASLCAQMPVEPIDISPINGETYYLINQLSGLQVDLDGGSTSTGQPVVLETRSFTSLTQRWAFTHLPGGAWAISNISDGLCLDSAAAGGSTSTVENTCSLSSATQQWTLAAASNGFCTLTNHGTGLVLDVAGGAN